MNIRCKPLAVVLAVFTLGVRAQQGVSYRPTIAVMDFMNKTGMSLPGFQDNMHEIISILLANSGTFRVLERQKVDSVIREQALSETVLMDDEQSGVRVGKMLGAEYLLTGTALHYDAKGTKFSGYGTEIINYTFTLKISMKIISTNTGEIVYGNIIDEVKTGRTSSTSETFDTGTTHELLENALNKLMTSFNEHLNLHPLVRTKTETVGAHILVSISSQPKGADVILDGAVIGNTPLKIKVGDGVHRLSISLAGYEPWEKQVRLKEGSAISAVLKKIIKRDDDFHIIIEERKR